MPLATQLSLNLRDEPDMLARLCRDLANGGVNLLALSAARGGSDGGAVRLLVANRELAEHALARAGYRFSADEVLFLEIKNRPGALAKVVEKLARAGIGVRSAFATANTRSQKSAVVIAVDESDLARAVKLLG